jgi:hypothetical protein
MHIYVYVPVLEESMNDVCLCECVCMYVCVYIHMYIYYLDIIYIDIYVCVRTSTGRRA